MNIKTKYLVRPSDFHIFELDESNNCFRSYSTKTVTHPDGTRPKAQEHFTFENLTKNYDFIPIDESEIKKYENKNKEYVKFISWKNRSDGHGGVKGGTMDEYLTWLIFK